MLIDAEVFSKTIALEVSLAEIMDFAHVSSKATVVSGMVETSLY